MSTEKDLIIYSMFWIKGIKGSFFLTGNFLRNRNFAPVVKRIISGGHYAGPHSDRHLLYIPWENRDTLLVTKEQFNEDLKNNIIALRKAGLKKQEPRWFLAPYEWYNSAVSRWSEEMGYRLVNFTPGTGTSADYTTPDMKNYRSSDYLVKGWPPLMRIRPPVSTVRLSSFIPGQSLSALTSSTEA